MVEKEIHIKKAQRVSWSDDLEVCTQFLVGYAEYKCTFWEKKVAWEERGLLKGLIDFKSEIKQYECCPGV